MNLTKEEVELKDNIEYSGEYSVGEYYGVNIHNELNDSIIIGMRTGGYSGGSCWNDDEPTYEKSDSDVDLDKDFYLKITEYIINLNNSLSPSAVKELLVSLTNEDSVTIGEYYGNSNDYNTYAISIKNIRDIIREIYKVPAVCPCCGK